ncbi:short-chain dehydrogenase/reductase SDR [Perkinsela sp. CCAP 1560/4]|nr:short-chain dehydrogenase/reductase SDR [Perkinsela sp. CCAP 1560/4]|eukprot:KNH07395.1 short-chain dehydrogenase/reductase SDR [Perkinsela sp. CCAP 1560/4]
MSTLLSIHQRLLSRAIELRHHKPALLLEAVDLCVANPTGSLPPALKDAINSGEHFFSPEKTMETMRLILASNEPQQDIFSKMCFNAASSWRSKRAHVDQSGEGGKWRLLGTEVQTSLLFFALHQRVQISLLQAVVHAVPQSLHVLPDAIFVQVYCGMRNSCPHLIDGEMQRRADDILSAQRICISDLVRLSLARHPGVAALRSLWTKISDRNIFPQDAFCFLHEGLEQPDVHLTSADNPMINRIYDMLHRRPDLLEESIYSFVHVYARNPSASTQWQREVDSNQESLIRCFLEDLVRGKVKIDLTKLKPAQLAWYIRFSCDNAMLREAELHALLHLIQTDGFRSTLETPTDSNRKAFTSFFIHRITLNLLTAVRSLPYIADFLPKFLCALMDCNIVELNYYYDKITTGGLKYIGAGKVVSALPLSKELRREMDRMAKHEGSVERSECDAAANPSRQRDQCVFLDVQWRVISQIGTLIQTLWKTRQTALLTNEVEKAIMAVMEKFIPRCPVELHQIFSLTGTFARSGNLWPLMSLKRLYRFSFTVAGKGAKRQVDIRHMLYVHEELEKRLVLTANSTGTDIKKCCIFLQCRFGVLSNMCSALLKSVTSTSKAPSSLMLIEERYLDAIREVFIEFHQFSGLLSVASKIVLAREKGTWVQVICLRLVKLCFRMLKYLLFLVDRHPQADRMIPENMKIVEKEISKANIAIAEKALRKVEFTKQLLADIQTEELDEATIVDDNAEDISASKSTETLSDESLEESIFQTEANTAVFTARFLFKQAEKLRKSPNDPNWKLTETIFDVYEVMTSITALSQGSFPAEKDFEERCDLKAAHIEVLRLLLQLDPEKYAVPFQKVNDELTGLLCQSTQQK